LENCDLLEVYSDLDKERLKNLGGFSEFVARDHAFTNTTGQADDLLEFTDNAAEDEYLNIMKQKVPEKEINSEMAAIAEDDEVNVDDI